jgi:hypothetical protein
MKFRPVHALLFSVVLIVGALWGQRSNAQKSAAELITINRNNEIENNSFSSESRFLINSASTSPQDLTSTDLVGRQLIVDYVDLATSGKATPESIRDLANQYVDSVPNLARAKVVGYSDIKITSNLITNLQAYSEGIKAIQEKHLEDINKFNSLGEKTTTVGPALYSISLGLSNAYGAAALSLEKLEVPQAVAPAHLRLVNSFLSSAKAARAISETEKDPATAFSGLITLSGNFSKEKAIFEEISQILIKNGI